MTELLQSKFSYDRIIARQESTRRAKLKAFLDQHKHASQWAVVCAALEDGLRHGVVPTDAMICDAISRCGSRRQLAKAKELYTAFYRKVGRSRPLAAHLAFMAACVQSADFAEAHAQLHRLLAFDRARLAQDPEHQPLVNDDLMTEYLRAALAASVERRASSGERAGASEVVAGDASKKTWEPWRAGLDDLLAVRKDPRLRPHNALTPLLLESATQLAEVGGQWELCLKILKGASAEQLVIPPEAYDASIRACYHHGRHGEVVQLMSELVATKTPPDERSVRLALVSTEEVTARERAEGGGSGTSASLSAWALSLTLFEAMQLNGIPLYQQSYEAPLRTCAMAGRWEEALGVLDAMRRDERPVSTELYRTALAARIEACDSYAQVERLLRLPIATEGGLSAVMYMAALRCCMRVGDWRSFERVNREMIQREMPETFDKMRLLIEAAHLQGKHHAVLARFARFDNVTGYERKRVEEAGSFVRLYEGDFDVSDRLLDMVMDAYEKVKGESRDPMVEVAFRAAVRRKEAKSGGGPMLGGRKEAPKWMFSQAAREDRSPPAFQ